MTKKVSINKDTARYYLRLEHALNQLCITSHIDADTYLGVEGWQREMFRDDLYEAWTERVAKKPFKPQRHLAGYADNKTAELLKGMKKK